MPKRRSGLAGAACRAGAATRYRWAPRPTDAQRIQRALEILRLTGQPMSALLAQGKGSALALSLPVPRPAALRIVAYSTPASPNASTRCLPPDSRDEVSALRRKYALSLELPSMRCVGYRQVWEAQDGLIPRKELRDRGIYAATRQLAKRQITWLSNTLPHDRVDLS